MSNPPNKPPKDPTKMLSRQIQFATSQWQALKVQAALEGRYTSEIIRAAVNDYLARMGTRKILDAAALTSVETAE